MIPESAATNRKEPSPASLTVPESEVLTTEQAALSPCPQYERSGAREVLLAQGKELAQAVIFQYERFCRAPFNQEESARLRGLQARFLEWERMANAQCPALDTTEEFPDTRLRPFRRELSIEDIARLRRTPTRLEAHFQSVRLARQGQTVRRASPDDGLWSGMPGGI